MIQRAEVAAYFRCNKPWMRRQESRKSFTKATIGIDLAYRQSGKLPWIDYSISHHPQNFRVLGELSFKDLNLLFSVVCSDPFYIIQEHLCGAGDCGLLRLAGVVILKVSIYV